MIAVLFWLCLGFVAWSLVGYGLVWVVLSSLVPRRPAPPAVPQKATMLIAARNEARDIGAKIASVLALDTGPHDLDILVVSDGSTDGTETAARAAGEGSPRLRVIRLDAHGGKAAALNRGLDAIPPDRVVVFSDANSELTPGALLALLAPFADPGVGGSIGQLSIPHGTGMMARAERLFWRYDNALKAAEDRLGGVVSAQGTLYAVRRALVRPVPPDMADDLVTSLAAVDAGTRLAFAPKAIAMEQVTEKAGQEFGRRVRSTERGWRGLLHYRRLMNPARTGLYAVQLISHKFCRRIVALVLPVLLVLNLMLLGQGWIYGVLFAGQVFVYGFAVLALTWTPARKLPGSAAAILFTAGHVAVGWALLRHAAGVRTSRWVPARG